MKVQSLSIVVPSGCLNKCKFCVANTNSNQKNMINKIEQENRYFNIYENDYIKRMEFARDNGCNTLMITGNGEPVLNVSFLKRLGNWNNNLSNPFRWIELQTSGVGLTDDIISMLRNHLGVSTISLSISSFDNDINSQINRTRTGYEIKIKETIDKLLSYNFNVRLSINLTDYFNDMAVSNIFKRIFEFGVHQVTFRKLYKSNNMDIPENIWINKHSANDYIVNDINEYIKTIGKPLEILPFGAMKYSVNGISTVIDMDCMNTNETKETLKYLILYPNCKLYSKWDDIGSLVF